MLLRWTCTTVGEWELSWSGGVLYYIYIWVGYEDMNVGRCTLSVLSDEGYHNPSRANHWILDRSYYAIRPTSTWLLLPQRNIMMIKTVFDRFSSATSTHSRALPLPSSAVRQPYRTSIPPTPSSHIRTMTQLSNLPKPSAILHKSGADKGDVWSIFTSVLTAPSFFLPWPSSPLVDLQSFFVSSRARS